MVVLGPGGTDKTLATAAGAAAGGYAASRVRKYMQQKDVVTTTERRCRKANVTSEEPPHFARRGKPHVGTL